MKKYKAGIYQNKANGLRIKVVEKSKQGKGWGKNTRVMYFTNNPGYGRGRFGMEGKSLDNFMSNFTKVKDNKNKK